MWAIIKVDNKNIKILSNELKKKLGPNLQIYSPKIYIENYKNKKIIKKSLNLIGDYVFCFHEEFKNYKIIDRVKFTKGLKYFLYGYLESQNEINNFISKCKKSENKDGFLTKDFYDLEINKMYKFNSGPFANKILKLIEIQKNRVKFLFSKVEVKIESKNFSITPC
tara:strand:- start:928 stop:1425 length:498 start_codon:yes stop_codon:yes gene_type:complete